MITLILLAIVLIVATAIIVVTAGAGCLAIFVVFGDVIVALAVFIWLIKKIFGKKNK